MSAVSVFADQVVQFMKLLNTYGLLGTCFVAVQLRWGCQCVVVLLDPNYLGLVYIRIGHPDSYTVTLVVCSLNEAHALWADVCVPIT